MRIEDWLEFKVTFLKKRNLGISSGEEKEEQRDEEKGDVLESEERQKGEQKDAKDEEDALGGENKLNLFLNTHNFVYKNNYGYSKENRFLEDQQT